MDKTLQWEVAYIIYKGIKVSAWGKSYYEQHLDKLFPKTVAEREAYGHNPRADVDVAMASAKALLKTYKMELMNV